MWFRLQCGHIVEYIDQTCSRDVWVVSNRWSWLDDQGQLSRQKSSGTSIERSGNLATLVRQVFIYWITNKRFSSVFPRAVIRFVSSLLHKMVDSLAPSVTNLLVRGKTVAILESIDNTSMKDESLLQVTIGIFGFEEEVIEKPVGPGQGLARLQIVACFRCGRMRYLLFSTVTRSSVVTYFKRYFCKNY